MNKEEKELLIKDLCARLPYGVKISVNNNIEKIDGISVLDNVIEYGSFLSCDVEEVKPYLFPLSSMTEEQMEELKELCNMFIPADYYPYYYWGIVVLYRHMLDDNYKFNLKTDVIDWFNKNHFDYMNLIEKGLAIDATSKNIY